MNQFLPLVLTQLNESHGEIRKIDQRNRTWIPTDGYLARYHVSVFEADRLTEAEIWYVSYRSNIRPGPQDGEPRCARATRKFRTEAEAKQFAEEIIKKGWSAIAGTLNPHTPKKTVSSTKILDWIAGKY
jgi:hypothetical protein